MDRKRIKEKNGKKGQRERRYLGEKEREDREKERGSKIKNSIKKRTNKTTERHTWKRKIKKRERGSINQIFFANIITLHY